MTNRPLEEDREERIRNEIVVDAYGSEEQAMGWYAYLEGTLEFPFRVRCRVERAISPLRVSAGKKYTLSQQIELGPAEHLALYQLQPVDIAFHGSGTPVDGEASM